LHLSVDHPQVEAIGGREQDRNAEFYSIDFS
jgi:hypothetical protein